MRMPKVGDVLRNPADRKLYVVLTRTLDLDCLMLYCVSDLPELLALPTLERPESKIFARTRVVRKEWSRAKFKLKMTPASGVWSCWIA